MNETYAMIILVVLRLILPAMLLLAIGALWHRHKQKAERQNRDGQGREHVHIE